VAFEELIFRGAVLYILLQRMGLKAIWISAAAFGIYHWFSFGELGQPAPMIFVFVITFPAGLIFAYAFAKTNSLYLPFALQFRYNFVNMTIFSNSNSMGAQWLIKEETDPLALTSMTRLLTAIPHFFGFPLGAYLLIRLRFRNIPPSSK
jgi:membrane protease YdiL (CAAX protease family)